MSSSSSSSSSAALPSLEGSRYFLDPHPDGCNSQVDYPQGGKGLMSFVKQSINDDSNLPSAADADLREAMERAAEQKRAADHEASRKANAAARVFFADLRASASSSASTSSVAAPAAAPVMGIFQGGEIRPVDNKNGGKGLIALVAAPAAASSSSFSSASSSSSSSSLSSSSSAPRAASAARAPAAPLAKPAEDGKEAKPKRQTKKSQYFFDNDALLEGVSKVPNFASMRWTREYQEMESAQMTHDSNLRFQAACRIAVARGRQTLDVVDFAESTVVVDLMREAHLPDGKTERSDELVSEIALCVAKAKMYAAKRESVIITDADREVAREILDAEITILDTRDADLRDIFRRLKAAAKEKCLKRKLAKAERELAKAKAEAESASPEPARKRGKFAVQAPPHA